MTDEEAAAIQARAEAATPGPWGVDEEYDREARYNRGAYKSLMTAIVSEKGVLIVPLTFGRMSRIDKPLNVEFIAHAREDIPALLAERAALVEIVRAVARGEAVWYDTVGAHCGFCDVVMDETHADGCPVTKARALIAD